MNPVLFRKTMRDLSANKGQTFALIAIVTLGVLSFIALIAAYNNLGNSYEAMYTQTNFAEVTFAVESAPEKAIDEVRKINGVDEVTGRLILDTGYLLPDDEPIRARLIGLPEDKRPDVNDLWIEDGRYFRSSDKDVAIVDSHFAKMYNLKVGDDVTPVIQGEKTKLEIIAIATSPEYIIVTPGDPQSLLSTAENFAVLFVPLSYLQEAYGKQDSINDFAVLYDQKRCDTDKNDNNNSNDNSNDNDNGNDNSNDNDNDNDNGNDNSNDNDNDGKNKDKEDCFIIKDIEEFLGPYQLKSTTLQEDQASNEALQLDLDSYEALAKSVPIIMLLIAAVSIFMTMGRTVMAQQPQVGLMKAIGYSNGAIFYHYLLFALFVGAIGALLGVVLGLAFARAITTLYAQELGVPTISVSFYPELIVFGVLLSLAFTILGGIFPARSATKRLPAEAMKYDPGAVTIAGRKSVFEHIFKTGIWGRLTIRNVFRVPRRTLSNLLGIVFAFVLVIMSWSWIDSLEFMLDKGFNQISKWDVQVAFNASQDENTREEVANWDDVIVAEPAIIVPAEVKAVNPDRDAEKDEIDITLTAFDPKQDMIKLDLIEKDDEDWTVEDALAKDKIILTPIAAEKLLLSMGDEVIVSNQFGSHRLQLSGIADQINDAQGYVGTETLTDIEPLTSTDTVTSTETLTSTQAMTSTSYAGLFNTLFLTTDPDQMDEIKKDLYKLPNAASAQTLQEARATYNLILGLFYVFVIVMLAFSLAMAFALLYNGITITITERQREFATMRSIGTSEAEIGRQLIVENMIIWVLAIVPGCLLGYWLAVAIGETLNTEWMHFRVVLDPWTYVFTSVLILVTMILAGVPAFKRLRKVDLATGTKGAV